MAIATLSSRDFNQDASKAKKAARRGPVFITDRGRPAHVLLTIEEYQRITGGRPASSSSLRCRKRQTSSSIRRSSAASSTARRNPPDVPARHERRFRTAQGEVRPDRPSCPRLGEKSRTRGVVSVGDFDSGAGDRHFYCWSGVTRPRARCCAPGWRIMCCPPSPSVFCGSIRRWQNVVPDCTFRALPGTGCPYCGDCLGS